MSLISIVSVCVPLSVTVLVSPPGQFYVMMSPQDVLQAGQRTIAPRTGITPRIEGARTTRDERRRATHNEGNSHLVQFCPLRRISPR